ncbi:MAG: hypothetical protein WCP53_13965, partial [Verrucomicrobiota bacterium]
RSQLFFNFHQSFRISKEIEHSIHVKHNQMKHFLVVILMFSASIFSFGQVIPEHITHKGIYDFLDEMASEKIITINSAVKPYSKEFIAQKLVDIGAVKESLGKRQQKELAFFLREYNLELNADETAYRYNLLNNKRVHASFAPFGVYYGDSLLRMVIRPQWGVNYFKNGDSTMYHQWGGAEMSGYIGSKMGFYVSLIDHTQPISTVRTPTTRSLYRYSSKLVNFSPSPFPLLLNRRSSN